MPSKSVFVHLLSSSRVVLLTVARAKSVCLLPASANRCGSISLLKRGPTSLMGQMFTEFQQLLRGSSALQKTQTSLGDYPGQSSFFRGDPIVATGNGTSSITLMNNRRHCRPKTLRGQEGSHGVNRAGKEKEDARKRKAWRFKLAALIRYEARHRPV